MLMAVACVIIAYLIGSISSAYIVSRLFGYPHILAEKDGRISAATVFRKVGFFPFLLVVAMDISLAVSAVTVARILTGSRDMMMLAGLAAVAGHNWSLFLRFRGGLGATAICGALGAVVYPQLVWGLGAAGLIFILTLRPGLSTVGGIITTSAALLIQSGFGIIALFPLALMGLMLGKRAQVLRSTRHAVQPKIISRTSG